MFWKYNLTTVSHIGALLEKEDVALKELMDEDDILQECKAQKQKLIDFLVRPDVLNEMVTLITQEPDEELEEKIRYKYSNIACELLTFDISAIHDALASDESLLDKLYSFLNSEKPLNPLLSSFFSKTMGKLVSRKTPVMFEYLKSKSEFIPLLLKHIETSAIMDLLSRLLTFTENIEMRNNIVNWLSEENVVKHLVALIDPAYSEDVNCNAAHALCDTIRASREHMSLLQEKVEHDPLLEAIESTEVVRDLLDHMFNGEKKESVIVNGISVLLTLLEFKKHGGLGGAQQIVPPQTQSVLQSESAPHTITSFFFRNDGPEQMTALDAERLSRGVNNVLEAVMPRLVDFHKLLLQPPPKSPITLTYGQLDPPLGYSRLEDAHLLSALIGTNTHSVNVELARLKVIPVLMDLFFKYTWNNFLHTQVEHAVGRILANEPTTDEEGNKVHPLLDQFLLDYKMTVRLLECFEDYGSGENSSGQQQRGYMGHLTKIANHIAQNAESGVNSALIQEKLKQLPEEHQKKWEEFVNGTLAEINKKNTTPLVGVPLPSASEEGLGFRGMPFSQDSSLQQVQQISSNFVDQFCFNDDFNETEDITDQLNRLESVHFQSDRWNLMQRNIKLFEQVCREKNSHVGGDDQDSDEEVWEEKAFNYRSRKESEDNSSDSDEEDSHVPSTRGEAAATGSEEMKMEVDNNDPWSSNLDSVPMDIAPVVVQNPWESAEQPSSTSGEQENWADFSNFSAFGSTAECSDVVSSTTAVAMETCDSSPATKFVSSSEVSSTSDSPAVPEGKSSEPEKSDTPQSEALIPQSGEPSSSIDLMSEAKVAVKDNKVLDSNKQNDSSLVEKETCSSGSVQNGPV